MALKTLDEIKLEREDRHWDIKLRIIRLYQRTKRSIRTVIRTPKWWIQRVRRGYSDRDMWNADIYLAGVLAGVLQWYIDKGMGVPTGYASKDDPYGQDVDAMCKRRDAVYQKHIAVFEEYAKNGCALNKKWVKEFGGVLPEDIEKSMKWLSKHFTELWD